jgi:transposase InsO family protein
VPYVPLSHLCIERLIATVRRECLDHVLFWNAVDLKRKLTEFQAYYNEVRVHSVLAGYPPKEVGTPASPVVRQDHRWQLFCRGLYELPVAA